VLDEEQDMSGSFTVGATDGVPTLSLSLGWAFSLDRPFIDTRAASVPRNTSCTALPVFDGRASSSRDHCAADSGGVLRCIGIPRGGRRLADGNDDSRAAARNTRDDGARKPRPWRQRETHEGRLA